MEVSMTQGREGALQLGHRHFAMRTERVNGSARIRMLGELDLSVIGLVDREMERAEASDASQIVLDLEELEFMDASGIRLLLHLNERSQSTGGRLRISGSGAPQVQRVIELTGVHELLPFED
jgi:anti-sigma B factor antagonist